MDRKQKIRVVVIIPVVAVLVVLGGVIYAVLQLAAMPPALTPASDQELVRQDTDMPLPGPGDSPVATEDSADAGQPGAEGVNPGEDDPVAAATMETVPTPSCAFDFLIGQSRAAAETQIGPLDRPVRFLHADDMMTMDHNPDRINVMLGGDDIVTGVTCG